MGERVHKSMLNAEVNLLFYFLTLFLAFFSHVVQKLTPSQKELWDLEINHIIFKIIRLHY